MPKKPIVNRVLYLQAFPLWGCGSGIYTKELAFEISKIKDIKTAIVCPESKEKIAGLKIYPLDYPFPVAFTGHPEWPVSRLYKSLTPKEITEVYKSFLSSVVRAVEDFKPNIIHVQHVSVLLWVANMIKLLYGIKFLVTSHGTDILAISENRIYVSPAMEALRGAKKITAVSKHTKKCFLNVFGPEFYRKTRVIAGGIHLEKFPLNLSIKIINQKYNLDGKKVILFSGKLTEAKGIAFLVKAAKDIKGDIYIIGDGPEKKNIEDLISKLGLTNVHLLGYMGDDKKEELREFYYRADVFVAPSVVDEAFGLSIIEAMAAKRPVVASKKGGIPSTIKNGINGVLIKAENSQMIAEACNRLLGNQELRLKMGENARKTIEQKFTWEKIAEKFYRLYKKIYQNGKNIKNDKIEKNKPH